MSFTAWIRSVTALAMVCVVGAAAGPCHRISQAKPGPGLPQTNQFDPSRPTPRPAAVGPELSLPGLQHVHHLTPSIYCGSAPEDAAALAALRDLHIRTIITVDGAAPEVELAQRFGLRYVHLPVGYDGISRERQLEIARAVRDLPGPLYIHCHHGLHRGPTAAVVAAMSCDGWTPQRAIDALRAIGTSPHYQGLYATAREFRPPTERELDAADASFPPVARPAGLVATMVQVDSHWDNLKSAAKRGWRSDTEHPDVDPSHEALLLRELFREAHRPEGAASSWPAAVSSRLATAEEQAATLEAALRRNDREIATATVNMLDASCTACHAAYRDERRRTRPASHDSLTSTHGRE